MWSLYWRLVGARVRSQMQYKTSFGLDLLGFGLMISMEFVAVVVLFGRFPSVGGWNLAEIALLYGLTSLAFSFAEMVGRGFDLPFEQMMQRGTFDAVLIRPQGSFFQVLASEFQLRRLGRSLQAAIVLVYAFAHLPVVWTPAKVLLVPLTLASGTVIYLALLVFSATICFWTIAAPEVINIFTYGGEFMTNYPLGIYNSWLRSVMIFVVPLAFINYPAALVLLQRTDPYGFPPALAWASPLVASAFFGGACLCWRFGVSKYQSSGS